MVRYTINKYRFFPYYKTRNFAILFEMAFPDFRLLSPQRKPVLIAPARMEKRYIIITLGKTGRHWPERGNLENPFKNKAEFVLLCI
ncbi:hypothetical protein FTO70_01230 [Methanosarcina sp. KYL-1]|uniref:hypothetical protein n=1 Tax=Methanosarcina sp. KYL-1 TaxID=2602068 RepID=UPI0021015198|nr:hypothetical protein [Methanosarcina sp. KYL-1]MCQ1534342.1 hypothetical protein [Methanosarcina sp. KYL-1]